MKPPEQNCFMVNYDQHAELLQTLVLDSQRAEVTKDWVSDLDELLAEYDVMQDTRRNPGGRAHIRNLRAHFSEMMDTHSPESPLYKAYRPTRTFRDGRSLNPCHVIGSALALTEIGGSIADGLQLFRKGSDMLAGPPAVLKMGHSQMRRLATLSGWEGDVRQLLLYAPNLLRMSVARRAFIGRMALQFGSPDLRTMSFDDIKRKFLTISVDEYLMALIEQRDEYRFENTPHVVHRAPYRKKWINEKLRSAEVVERIGPKVLQAYFRYAPPKSHTLYHYPHLADLYGRTV